ncbi:MAG: hypothetical protein NZM28_06130 [Fimbriimonadales bacterium]|nr:hypothetical protein [Fimbriimonadales bacterium]
MPKFKEGDRVQVRAREAQGKEAQEGRYAPHLANATGAILKIYSPQEIAVDLELDSLPEAIRERHAEQQTRMHERWLNSLSEEARNRLTDDEKTFRLRYVALLAEDDLLPLKAGRAAAKPSEPATADAAPSPKAKTSRKPTAESATPARPTAEDLEKLEEQYLRARKKR